MVTEKSINTTHVYAIMHQPTVKEATANHPMATVTTHEQKKIDKADMKAMHVDQKLAAKEQKQIAEGMLILCVAK